MLPYFKKSECNEKGESEYHGASGPLNVSSGNISFNTTKRFLEGAKQSGFTITDDFNGASQEGAGYFQCTIKNGQRHSAASAYLRPALARENLDVITGAFSKRIPVGAI